MLKMGSQNDAHKLTRKMMKNRPNLMLKMGGKLMLKMGVKN
jgi:hypothetical protein